MGSFSISASCIIFFSAAFVSAAFQFSFGQPSRNGNEATDGSSTMDIQVPIEITVNPSDAFLSAGTIVMVSVSGGSATCMSISF